MTLFLFLLVIVLSFAVFSLRRRVLLDHDTLVTQDAALRKCRTTIESQIKLLNEAAEIIEKLQTLDEVKTALNHKPYENQEANQASA